MPPKKLLKGKAKSSSKPRTKVIPKVILQDVKKNNKQHVPEVKTIEEKYQKKTQLEHILTRPDSYVGEIKIQTENHWIYDETTKSIIEKEISYSPGLYKIIDEIIVNACDHCKIDNTCDTIKVNLLPENKISVWNNGNGIPIEIHKEHNVYVPELIFGHLLTSTNYDDTEKRTTGGRNGYGAKLTNIFSKFFSVETVDANTKKKYYQEFTNNMSIKSKPVITNIKAEHPRTYTEIVFQPDLEKFGLTILSEDMIAYIKRRVYDIAGILPNIKVFLNDSKLVLNSYKKYIELYKFESDEKEKEEIDINTDIESDSQSQTELKSDLIYEEVNERWKVGVKYNLKSGHKHISTVNGINTSNGGNHVNYVLDYIINCLIIMFHKKNKDIQIKPAQIKENIIIFIDCIIENPSFTSQTKETLKTKISEFGSICQVSDKFIKKLAISGIFDQVLMLAKIKEQAILKKTDGKKTVSIRGIPKLEDANWAGTKKSPQCRLILTEGDSAKAMAMSGRSVIGADRYGIFPLKGKLLNVREATAKQLVENEEIINLKKILGLQTGKKYKDTTELRYGGIVILTDADEDGKHIRALVINFIHYSYPDLMDIDDFITTLETPIVKATNNRTKDQKIFYNLTTYSEWKMNPLSKINDYTIKYYKGLGTSNATEAKEYFQDFEKKLIRYVSKNDPIDYCPVKRQYEDTTMEAITLAFAKPRANDRKIWLLNYDKDKIIASNIKEITIPQFIHKELIHFSNDDNNRSIPSICDGLKPSQRKILYGAILYKLLQKRDEKKVAQLAGFVSDKTSYHHGEMSLTGTIVNMAQNFVGSNNINILYPSGQFGTRLLGGKDSASPRYTFTCLETLTRSIFKQDDDKILNYLDDDGTLIEPEYFIPIIPMILVNGTSGIGTGFSTDIPCYNPLDIIENLLLLMDGKKTKYMTPWYKGFLGKINCDDNEEITMYGNAKIFQDDNKIHITELPIGTWTTPYKEFLEDQVDKGTLVTSYTSNITDDKIDFTLTMKELNNMSKKEVIYNKLKLVSKISTKNMHLYDHTGKIKKYMNTCEIIKEFYIVRLNMYTKRKAYITNKLIHELDLIKYKVLFIQNILDGTILINKQKKEQIINKLVELKYPTLSNDFNDIDKSYDYLTSMYLFSLTQEKIDELQTKLQNKEEELAYVNSQTEINIWKTELNELLIQYNLWINTSIDTSNKIKPKKKKNI